MHEQPSRSDFISALTMLAIGTGRQTSAAAASSKLVDLAPGIAYVPGDVERALTCNTGVIMGGGRITIVDAAIPEGAAAAYAAIRARTDLPVVRVIDTHYHLDHTYGNAYWSDRGAHPVAYAGLRAELAKSEPELFGGGPGLWQKMAGMLPELRSSHPLSPSYVSSGTTFGSGSDAITIIHPGIGHTHSDAVAWMPRSARSSPVTSSSTDRITRWPTARSVRGSAFSTSFALYDRRSSFRDMDGPADQNSSSRSNTTSRRLREKSTVQSNPVAPWTLRFLRSIGACLQMRGRPRS